jgi:hypothetical protein
MQFCLAQLTTLGYSQRSPAISIPVEFWAVTLS